MLFLHESIELQGGCLYFIPRWLDTPLADVYFRRLLKQIAWQQSQIHIAGQRRVIPRLNAWYGDADAYYQYSGHQFKPRPWNRALLALRRRLADTLTKLGLNAIVQRPFNSVLANYYRSGQDSVAWHADDEPELGVEPLIASVSLGGPRDFLLKPKPNSGIRSSTLTLSLPHGSLLVMNGATQTNWLHSVPKRRQADPRVNLTYRFVEPIAHR